MNDAHIEEVRSRVSWLEDAAFYVLLGVMFLLPIFFVPSIAAPFLLTKTVLLLGGILIALFLYVVSRLEDGRLTVPFHYLIAAAWAVPIIYFISAFLSNNLGISLKGAGFSTDTFGFIAASVLLFSIVPLFVRSKERILRIYVVLLLSFSVLAVFQTLRLIFGADFLSFGIFTSSVSNLLGKWNDLAIFFGLTAILSLVTLEGLELNKSSRGILYAVIAVSLAFLAIINFFPVWLLIGIFALAFFVYGITKGTFGSFRQRNTSEEGAVEVQEGGASRTNKVSFLALAVLVISLAFIIFGNSLGTYTSSLFNITQVEARPSWQTTVDIAQQTYKDNLLFGSGPNTFVQQWTAFKPNDINNTIFWNIDFTSGIGFIPTSFVTTGILGGIAWIVFLGLFLYAGIRALIFRPTEDRYVYYLILSSFLGSAYLWVLSIVYIPNTVILALAFFLTGIFVTSLRFAGVTTEKEITFSSNPRIGFVAVLVLTVVLILDAVALYIVGQQYVAAITFQQGVAAFNIEGDIDKAALRATQAVRLSEDDRALRLLSELGLVRLGQVLGATDLSQEEQRNQFQAVFSGSIQNAQAATRVNANNYQNWMALGRVYGSVVPLGIEGAHENASSAYDRAIGLYPNNPVVYLSLAQLEVARGDLGAAKEFITASLEKKNNYTEAIFLLAQIQIQEGDLVQAIRSVEAATFLSPNNSVLFFQLGLLRYNEGNDAGAIVALEQAIGLNTVYSNARYFLGLSYFRTGRTPEAIVQFERIAALNPDNEGVQQILGNLRADRDPFDTAPLPREVDDLEGLPI